MGLPRRIVLTLSLWVWAVMSSCAPMHVYEQKDMFDFIKEGDFVGLERLLRSNPELIAGAQIEGGYTPLMYACWENQYKCAEVLLKHGADPNQAGLAGIAKFEDPLNLASACSDEELLMLLKEKGAVAKENRNPVYSAVYQQKMANLKWLLDNGFSPNGRHFKESPFLKAIDLQNVRMVDLFIERGACLEGGLSYDGVRQFGWFITAYHTQNKKLIERIVKYRLRSEEFRILGDDQFAMWYAEKNGLRKEYVFFDRILDCRPRDPADIVTLPSRDNDKGKKKE